MTHSEIFALIDGARERGVLHLKTPEIEFQLIPGWEAPAVAPNAEKTPSLDVSPRRPTSAMTDEIDRELFGHSLADLPGSSE